ncbi:MAG: putative peptidoglycan glycosyltransferase FtsW [Pseudomonadota bacterium]
MTHMNVAAAPRAELEHWFPRWWRTVDKTSLSLVAILFLLGLLLGQAASPPLAERNGLGPFYYVTRQAAFGMLALIVMLTISAMPMVWVRRCAVLGFLGAFIAVALLPAFGTDFGKGAVRWYSLGFMSVQPSEFLKPGFVAVAAWMMAGSYERGGPPGRILATITAGVLIFMLAMQPDFGQATLILSAWAVMMFVAGAPMFILLGLGGIVLSAAVLAYNSSEHVARRIDGFLSPAIDPLSQIGFAQAAIREGGLFGVGLGEGQIKWRLPDAHTDYIIAVAAEEYGLVMVLIVVALFATIAVRALWRLRREKDPFIRIAGAGLVTLVAVQAFINIGVSARLLPEKGMTLPFVSYGGSSVLAIGITLGILFALTRTRPTDDLEDAFFAGNAR